jgi:hypothetical protein
MFTIHIRKHSCKSTNGFKTTAYIYKTYVKINNVKIFVNTEDTVKFLMSETRSVDSGCDRI